MFLTHFNRKNLTALFFYCLTLLWILDVKNSFAEDLLDGVSRQVLPVADRFTELEKSVTDTIEVEKQLVENLKGRQADAVTWTKAISLDISQFNILSSSIGNRIQLPDVPVDALKKVRQTFYASLIRLEEYHKQLLQETENYSQQRLQTEAQIAFNQKQLEDMKQVEAQSGAKRASLSKIGDLILVLKGKLNLLIDIQEGYTQKAQLLTEYLDKGNALLQKIDGTIEDVRKKTLFQRKANPFKVVNSEMVLAEIKQIVTLPVVVSSRDFWASQIRQVWLTDGYLTVTYMMLLAAWIMLLIRGHKNFKSRVRALPVEENQRWQRLTSEMIGRESVFIGLAAVFFLAYQMEILKIWSDFFQFAMLILLSVLFSKWLIRYLKHLMHEGPAFPGHEVLGSLIFLIKMIRVCVIVFFTVQWILGSASVAAWFVRLLIEAAVVAWAFTYSRKIRKIDGKPVFGTFNPWWLTVFLAYFITGGGLVAELAGFGSFALYWLVSWYLTAVVLMWGKILFRAIREWGVYSIENRSMPLAEDEAQDKSVFLRWIAHRVSQLTLGIFLALLLLLVWGEKGAVTEGLFKVLTYPLTMGSLSLSLMGLIKALMVLFVTHVAATFWRHFLRERILYKNVFEPGLKDSISKINHYIIWAVGAILALHAFGLNTATLAVAFGALGVGLGFGLQNIFNNFISGVILLFERPIQVGDAVEIGGIWGTVQKINFRSTVVQTFDNASMIIPNSEFVSSKVVNWTFKDRRLRRKLSFGVAYGSDVELVRKTLLEIAAKTKNILKYPAPDVVFYEHGESTLNFWLRYWTHVEDYYQTETDVRFDVERLFKERNISIAFPQRDVHVYVKKNNVSLL